MPNKTIYVSDDDLPLFERAQELSGDNLSAVVVRALRRFIEIEEAKEGGMDEVRVLVGTAGYHRRKRFTGVRLVRWLQSTGDRKGTQILNVYRTAKDHYVLHTRTVPYWKLSDGDPDYMGDPKNWGVGNGLLLKISTWGYDWEAFKVSGDYTLEVFDTLEEMKPHVSSELYQAVVLAGDNPEIEDLDI